MDMSKIYKEHEKTILATAFILAIIGVGVFFSYNPFTTSAISSNPCVDADQDGYGAFANPNCQYPEADCDDNDALRHLGPIGLCEVIITNTNTSDQTNLNTNSNVDTNSNTNTIDTNGNTNTGVDTNSNLNTNGSQNSNGNIDTTQNNNTNTVVNDNVNIPQNTNVNTPVNDNTNITNQNVNSTPTNNNTNTTTNSNTNTIADSDQDGVPDTQDECTGTLFTELNPPTFPTKDFGKSRNLLVSGVFSQMTSKGILASKYSLTDTRGCSCKQILDFCGVKSYGEGEYKYGCSNGVVDTWVKKIGKTENGKCGVSENDRDEEKDNEKQCEQSFEKEKKDYERKGEKEKKRGYYSKYDDYTKKTRDNYKKDNYENKKR